MTNTIHSFDEFLLGLERQVAANPTRKSAIIEAAIASTGCPYLKQKMADPQLGCSREGRATSI